MSHLPGRPATALLVVDMQNDVLADCHDAAGVTSRISGLVDRAREAGVPVLWVQHEGGLERGTIGWELVPELVPAPGEPVVAKAYRDAFCETTLGRELGARGIGRLVVCGAQTDYCVRTTCSRAASLGYDVTLVEDAHTTVDLHLPGRVLPAADVVAHHNLYWSTLTYPGQTFTLERARWVRLDPDAA